MKSYYVCEYCGSEFQNEEDAKQCEAKCAAKIAEEEKKRSDRKAREKQIIELCEEYKHDYGTYPFFYRTAVDKSLEDMFRLFL